MKLLTLLLALSSAALAGFLPFMHDRPKRDNPHDPRVRPLDLPAFVLPTPTASPTPLPTCGGPDSGSAFATFESTADGFVADTCCGFVAHTPALSGVSFCKGAQALCSTASIVHGGSPRQVVLKKNFGSPQNWSGKVVGAWAYFNAGFSGGAAQVYIKSNGYVYSNGPVRNPPAGGGWVYVAFDLAGAPSYIAGATNTAQVEEVGLQFYSNAGDPDGSLNLCIDEFLAL